MLMLAESLMTKIKNKSTRRIFSQGFEESKADALALPWIKERWCDGGKYRPLSDAV